MPQIRRTRTAPGTLNRDAILDTAMAIAQRDGIGTLTMRGIADELGVSAMGLYRHVRTKEELLALVADRYFTEIEYPTDRGASWQERVAAVFRSVRTLFNDHPDLAQILAAQPVDGTSAYRGAEVVLAALHDAGMTGGDAAAAFDTLRSYTAGFSQREVARRHPDAPRSIARLHSIGALAADDFPHVRALAGPLIVTDADERFEQGLTLLITGIEQQIASRSQ